MYSQSKPAVFTATVTVIAGFVATIAAVDAALLRVDACSPEICIGVSFAAVQTTFIAALTLASGMAKAVQRRRDQRGSAAGSSVRERLAAFVTGESEPVEWRNLYRAHPRLFEAAVLELLRVTQGGVRERVASAAEAAGLVDCWRQGASSRWSGRRSRALECLSCLRDADDADLFRTALRSPDRRIRMQALRCIVGLERAEDLELAFSAAVKEPLLTRALISRDLQKHSLLLSGHAIPQVLRHAPPGEVVSALELLIAWNRPIGVDGVTDLCRHADQEVRVAALRALAVVPPDKAVHDTLLHALSTGTPEDRRVAAAAAAAHNLTDAIPELLDNVRSQPFPAALAGAMALCRLGPEARDLLERDWARLEPQAAAAALEALDAFRTGRSVRAGQP
jgi:hypothetical protein